MRITLVLVGLLLFAGLTYAGASGDRAEDVFEQKGVFTSTDGMDIYKQNCAGCHMPKGEGARGAGMYPHLANNKEVESPVYTGYVVMYGLRGMPSFEPDLTDEQIAAVSNHVSVAFGNKGTEKVTEDEIKRIRPETPVQYIDW